MQRLILFILIVLVLTGIFREDFHKTYFDGGLFHPAARLLVFFAQPDAIEKLIAKAAPPQQTEPSPPQTDHPTYNLLPKRVTISHVQGNEHEIAYGTNFTTLGLLFAPPYHSRRFMPMLDLRGHRFDDNTYAANVGVIGRYIPSPELFCYILGLNAYYDYRQGGLGYFQQVGAGAEILGKRWDFRANAYVPFGGKKNTKNCVFDDFEGGFVITNSFLEEVSYSFNAEVGYLAVNSKNFLFYTAIGPYYIAGRKCDWTTAGVKARIRPQYKDYFAIDFSVSYDSLFKTIYQGAFIVYVPLYQIVNQNKRPCGITDRQIYQPVERFEVMPLMRQSCWHSNF